MFRPSISWWFPSLRTTASSWNVHVDLWRYGLSAACLRRFNTLHVAVTADVTDDMLLNCAAPKVLIGVSSPTSATGIQRALQESLWALGSANGNATNLARYADGPSWLGLTSFEEGTALVQRLLGPIFMTETSTLAQLWFALQIHEAMHN